MMHRPYAYICNACDHPASMHLAKGNFDLKLGPYVCTLCECAIRQDAPMTGLTRWQFMEHERRAGR